MDNDLFPTNSGKTGTILVVDDMAAVLQMVGVLLGRMGYAVHLAGNARDALLLLEAHAIDLIVTDVMMPECDGIAFLKEVRQRTTEVPVVLMTGGAQLDMAMEAIKNGAFDLITKPLDAVYFRKVVEKALEHRRLSFMERNYQSELERTVAEQTVQLKEALLELDKFHRHAGSFAQERNDFLSTLTHELRTPMNGILCPLSMLAEAELGGEERELVEIASLSADRMLQLVEQLLSFAQSRKKRTPSDDSSFDLRELSNSLARVHAPLFGAKGIALTLCVDEALPGAMVGDRELIGKVAEILLSNALKFTETGMASLSLGIVQDVEQLPALHLQVADTGIGIPPEKLEKIFEPFFQVDGGLTRRRGGLGLGLSQARQIVQHLGGKIWAESTLGSGSTLHVELPL